MSKFKITTPPIEGIKVIKPTTLSLSRDYLTDLERRDDYSEMGLAEGFAHHYTERFARGVIRGLHFQRADVQAKLVAVTSGRILDVVVDLRPESRDFGAAFSVELSAENETMIYIPPYFAHGFLTLEPNTEVVYNCTIEHDQSLESSIIWDDEILAIEWQFERYEIDRKYLNISQRDKKSPSFRSYNQNTLWLNRAKVRRR